MLDKNVQEYLNNLMVLIPEGKEIIRDYKDEKKWISSNSQMSIPGQKGRLTEIETMISIDEFLIGKYPVTKGLYESVTQKIKNNLENDTPIVNVSWYDAIKFCNLLSKECNLCEYYIIDENQEDVDFDNQSNGYRLATDAEWQYCARAGTKGYRYGDMDDIGWYVSNSNNQVQKVGQKIPNKWGLYDMLGNVWEWCWDLYDPKLYGPYRIFRGGSWAEEARGCGATCRRRAHPLFEIDDLGFRLARNIK